MSNSTIMDTTVIDTPITNTFTWTIPTFDLAGNINGLENVVKTIHWRYRITSSDELSAEIYGAVALNEPEAETFVPYDQVTQELTEEWLESALDINSMQAYLTNVLQGRRNPQVISQKPHWVPDLVDDTELL